MCSADTWAARFAVLDDALSGLLDSAPEPAPEVRYAWWRLHRTGGRVPIGRLVGDTGWSARYLQARMRAETGLTPKEAARVIRFDLARRCWATDPSAGVGDVAARHGYFDQSHFDREFRALAGCSPSTWLAEEFRNIQDGHWSPAADSTL